MKKHFAFGLSIALLLTIASCSTNNNNNNANNWTYTNQTYNIVSSSRSGSTINFVSTVPQGTLALHFYNNIPVAAGSYTAVNGAPTAAGQVQLAMALGSITFNSTGLDHANIAVTVASGTGKITAAFPRVMMSVSPFYTDSTFISGTVTEQ